MTAGAGEGLEEALRAAGAGTVAPEDGVGVEGGGGTTGMAAGPGKEVPAEVTGFNLSTETETSFPRLSILKNLSSLATTGKGPS